MDMCAYAFNFMARKLWLVFAIFFSRQLIVYMFIVVEIIIIIA